MQSGHCLAERREGQVCDVGRIDPRQRLRLRCDLLADEATGKFRPERGVECAGLGATEPCPVGTLRAEGGQDEAVGVDLEVAGPDVG
jgi:hypothetical protein